MLINLKPLEVRKQSIEQVIERLRGKSWRRCTASEPSLRSGTRHTNWRQVVDLARYQYALTGLDKDEVVRWAPSPVAAHSPYCPKWQTRFGTTTSAALEQSLLINRARAAEAGVSIADIDERALRLARTTARSAPIRFPINFHRRSCSRSSRASGTSLRIWLMCCSSKGVPADVDQRDAAARHTPMWISHYIAASRAS